ncbi:hypothetical protein H8D30_01380 [bacterium]|nr:hypothetical protein [bacterium]
MEKIKVVVTNSVGTRSNEFKLPPHTEAHKLIKKCESLWSLPTTHEDGQPIARYLYCKRTSGQMGDRTTLQEGGIQNGDRLEIKERMIAG